MKLGTLLRLGTLAIDIVNHPSTQQLSTLVKNGVQRRTTQYRTMEPLEHTQSLHAAGPSSPGHVPATRVQSIMNAPQQHVQTQQWPVVPVKQAMKYVTPENLQKAIQWQGIIRSFFEK